MKIGVPSEIKAQESRVGLTPLSVQELTNHGHEVLIQDKAGFGAGF
jgi:alanine dehydrogenase